MAKKPKLSLVERLEIKILLDKGYQARAIARSMCRSPNTISYEIKVNGGVRGYHPHNADQYARTRKKDTRRAWSKIEHTPALKAYIIEKLEAHWNPDEISGRMKKERKPWYASKTAIYAWLWSVYGQQYCVHLYSGRYHPKKQVKKTERVMIPHRVGIAQRPHTIKRRTEAGHWERDTIVSRKGCSGGVSVGSERFSRLIDATLVTSMSTYEHMEAVRVQQRRYVTLTETFDNGIENKAHETLGIPTYFCEPYRSWEKGGVEHANKMIRRYFPKGTNFRTVSARTLRDVVVRINGKPRKVLGYCTALEVARVCGIIKREGVLIEG